MLTILKLTVANMKQKKFRSILIVLSIVLSVALMYTVLSLSSSTNKIFEMKVRKEVGNSEFMVMPEETSGEQYIPGPDFTQIKGLDYSIPVVSAYGYTEIEEDMVPIAFTGITAENYKKIFPLKFVSQLSEDLTDHKVWIGEETASKYGIKLGEKLTVTIGGIENTFQITGIAEDKNNNLGYDLGRLELVVSQRTISDLLGIGNKVSAYYVNYLSGTDRDQFSADLEATFPDRKINDVLDMEEINQVINMVKTSLLLMVLAVIMVSAFIIYSSFKIIAIERMPLMGTLRSIGSTRKMTVCILLYEGLFYSLIGGILGNILGTGILSVSMKMMLQSYGIRPEDISYINPIYFLAAFAIGLILTVGSAILPILKTSRRSIRSIIFSEIKNEKHSSINKSILGFIFIMVAAVLFVTAPIQLELVMDIFGVILVMIGGSLIIPVLSRIFSFFLSQLFKPIYKDTLGVTMMNMKNDRTMMNNIMLLAMGLGVILMINNFSSTVSSAVVDLYADGKMDAVAYTNLDQSYIDEVKKVEGVDHVYTTKTMNDIKANQGSITLMYLEGMDGHEYSEYAWDEFGSYLTDDLMKTFKSRRTAIITRFTAKKYDLKKGDILKIDLDGKELDYQIIEIVPSIMNNGNMTYVYDKFLEEDAEIKNYQSMYLNFKEGFDQKEVIQKVKKLMPYGILPVQTLDEMREQNMKSNNAILIMMKSISIIAMFIGVIGILNNFTISFLSRKKLLATMRSLGLSKQRTVRNMLFEAFLCGCLGTLSGLVLGTVLLKSMCYVVEAMGIPSDVLFYNPTDYVFVLVSGIFLSMLSAVLPAIRIAKDNIVAGLRYE